MKILHLISLLLLCNGIRSNLLGYLQHLGTYFGIGYEDKWSKTATFDQNVPYEVSEFDEKFISEAAKLTGTTLSDLDSCQHRVVLKLQTSCSRMNDEQLAKMTVMLLNCQAAVEERTLYSCTDEMSIKDCTSNMDSDMLNIYHIMGNRVRAVCYTVRQVQFRGLTEHTINKLVSATQDQLKALDKITKDQESLHYLAEQSLQSMALGQEQLGNQQKDIQMAQLHSQLLMENNINRLVHEKQLILETRNQLLHLSETVQVKLLEGAEQLTIQSEDVRVNHKKILDDLVAIQTEVQSIFQNIEESSNRLAKQSELAWKHYQTTLAQLALINATVHSLVSVIGGTRKALDERLVWLYATLGDTELAFERLYAITWHFGLLLLAMIGCAFLGARMSTRFIVASFPPLNLALTFQQYSALDPLGLTITLLVLITVQTVFIYTSKMWQYNSVETVILWIKLLLHIEKPKKDGSNSYITSPEISIQNRERYKYTATNGSDDDLSEEQDSSDFAATLPRTRYNASRSRSRTPLSLNGFLRGTCSATTRTGSLCKLSALPGRSFCHRHQAGDSIYP